MAATIAFANPVGHLAVLVQSLGARVVVGEGSDRPLKTVRIVWGLLDREPQRGEGEVRIIVRDTPSSGINRPSGAVCT